MFLFGRLSNASIPKAKKYKEKRIQAVSKCVCYWGHQKLVGDFTCLLMVVVVIVVNLYWWGMMHFDWCRMRRKGSVRCKKKRGNRRKKISNSEAKIFLVSFTFVVEDVCIESIKCMLYDEVVMRSNNVVNKYISMYNVNYATYDYLCSSPTGKITFYYCCPSNAVPRLGVMLSQRNER